MNIKQFLQNYSLSKNSKQKSNITSIDRGKWYIPENKLKEFYDIVYSNAR